jgi:hypothetical protein
MSNELESDRATVADLQLLGPMVLHVQGPVTLPYATETVRVPKFDKPAVEFMFQVLSLRLYVQLEVFCLSERGLRFRNLGVCGHDLI